MKLGLSSYSFRSMLQDGSLSIEGLFGWLEANRAEHLEVVPFSFARPGEEGNYELTEDAETLRRIGAASAATGIPVSGLCIGANFIDIDAEARAAAIARVKHYVDLTADLGARFLRHDVVTWSRRPADTAEVEREFAGIADACRQIADHAAARNVVTSVEDHGFFMNSSERVKRLLLAVYRQNFKMTLDVGNFLCVDEDPLMGTRASLRHAGFVHLKDFYVRRTYPGPDWLETYGGQYIRGAVFGFGDLETRAILQEIVASGYDGFVSLEYEANEPAPFGCATGLDNIRRMLSEI